MVSTGLKDAGYEYLLIQECITPAGSRDSNGVMIVDPIKFPYGMPNLVQYINSKGLKAGVSLTS
jgi:alpha-galactosidase